MKNKKIIMFFSSILILIFHFWINVFNNNIESFIRSICYIGVDIFFFLTAYSLSKNEIKDYKEFLIKRFIKIYLLFIIFSIIALFYKNWNFSTFILVITGIQLFIKGGGAFLWFVPSIMIVYILLPLYNKYIKKKYIVILIWLLLTIIISYFTNYKEIFIFTNRIPIILIGSYLSKNKIIENINKKKYLIIMSILLIIGIIILYNFNYYLCDYIYDIYYLLAIPFTLGLILFLNLFPENKIINILSTSTLEMYCFQMLFGYKIANIISKLVSNLILYNILIIIIIIFISIIIHYIYGYLLNIINKNLKIKK